MEWQKFATAKKQIVERRTLREVEGMPDGARRDDGAQPTALELAPSPAEEGRGFHESGVDRHVERLVGDRLREPLVLQLQLPNRLTPLLHERRELPVLLAESDDLGAHPIEALLPRRVGLRLRNGCGRRVGGRCAIEVSKRASSRSTGKFRCGCRRRLLCLCEAAVHRPA